MVAAALVAATARAGLEVGPDGAEYLGVADRLADGHGFTRAFGLPGRRLDHYGPLYPALLAPGELVGLGARTLAWWLHVALFALDAVLVGVLTQRLARGRVVPGLVAGALFACTASLLVVYSSVLSEPVYLSLELAFVFALVEHRRAPRPTTLVGAAAAAGIAVLARFVGFALIGAGVGVLLADRSREWRARVRDAIGFGVVGSVPFAIWTVTARLGGAHPTDRALEWHPITAAQLGEAVRSVGSLVVGREASDDLQVLGAVFLGVGLVAVALASRLTSGVSAVRHGDDDFARLRVVLATTGATHLVVIALTMWFADRTTPGSLRILSPVLICALPLVVGAADALARRAPAARLAIVGVLLVVGALRVVDVGRTVDAHGASSLRWAAPVWERSPTVRAVERLPADTVIWTNAPDLVWYRTDRASYRVTSVRVTGYRGGELVADADERLARLRRSVAHNDGVVVLFDDLEFRSALASVDELEAAGFSVADRYDDGVVLRAEP
ncbi:MAG TPA: hypothetical protein VFZ83_10735 [Acidimicrobiia bacterium]|nr:hypothetical protein [Acidimicrobiia bacterium]